MPPRTIQYIKAPWTGGWNTSVDKGILPDNDLVLADNVVFTASGSRLKREGIDAWDASSDVPAVTGRSSSGTTRTLIFASSLTPTDTQCLVVGERIVITQTGSVTNEDKYVSTLATPVAITAISTTNVSNDTITYTSTLGSLSEATTATSTLSVARRPYIDIKDFWYLDGSSIKTQIVMAISDQGKLFKYDSTGKRKEVVPLSRAITSITNASPGVVTVTSAINGLYVGMPIVLATTGSLPTGLTAGTTYYVAAITTPTTVFTLAATPGGAAINTSSAGSGTHTVQLKSLSAPMGSGALTSADSIVFANRYIASFSGTGNKPIYFDPVNMSTTEYYAVGGFVPDCSIMQEHLGRLWANDKTSDLLHYSTTGDFEEWYGVGDSGALDIVAGDGDPTGLTAIFPPFKGRLVVAKRDRSFQITGYTPEDWTIQPMSNGVGCESHQSVVAVDMDDVYFISRRGIHSLGATASFGDFEAQYISASIKPTFERVTKDFLPDSQGVYIPELNAAAFAVTEYGNTSNNAIWFYSTTIKGWFRWPDQSPISLCTHQDSSGKQRLMWGTLDGKVRRAQNGDFTDYTDTPIYYKIQSATIYPDNNPLTTKGFKKISFLYKPLGRYQFTLKVWIDNMSVQTKSFEAGVDGDVLGTTFVLGSSVLGSDTVFAPFTVPIDGYGRGLRFEITNYNPDQQVEIYGYIIEYEPAGVAQEAI